MTRSAQTTTDLPRRFIGLHPRAETEGALLTGTVLVWIAVAYEAGSILL